ncbi:hypothetical protein [Nocardia grenadensis]|uniref:hypothetical protein n=1 Tax=Nocardia grenadensis TaxID=931537 RepID=UPI000AD6E7D7|nr:hypothetical protein [Nocardia grenadensis]
MPDNDSAIFPESAPGSRWFADIAGHAFLTASRGSNENVFLRAGERPNYIPYTCPDTPGGTDPAEKEQP